MPIVCLSNTFARRQTLKLAKQEKVKQKLRPDLTIAQRGVFSEPRTLRIPHPRPQYQASPQSAPNVQYGRSSVRVTRADLINAESKLGSTIFGPIPAGHRREFFHDQQNVWIWHEDWQDGHHNTHQMTVRYEVRTSGVYKKVSTGKYFKLEGDELDNFRRATHAYLYVIKQHLYNQAKISPTSAA